MKVKRIAFCKQCGNDVIPIPQIWCMKGCYYRCPSCGCRGNLNGTKNIFYKENMLTNFTKPFKSNQRFSRITSSHRII